jgi:hypothetical protein
MAYSMHHVPTSGDRQAMASCIPKEEKLLRGSRTLVSSLGGSTLFLCLYYINPYNLYTISIQSLYYIYTISILYGNMVYYGIIMRSLHLRQLTPGMIGMGLSQKTNPKGAAPVSV